MRKEAGDRRWETGGRRQEVGDRIRKTEHGTGDRRRRELSDVYPKKLW